MRGGCLECDDVKSMGRNRQQTAGNRLGQSISAEDMARRVDVSRAILYRLEKGALKKVETLERVAGALDVSLASLMGVGAEYYRNAAAFFERKRQLEEQATQVQGNFMPVSFLLMSDEYIRHLRTMF